MKGVVLFDRDGTLIEDPGYLSDPDDVKEIPGAAEGLRLLSRAGYALAIVSNQAGLAKGKFREDQMDAVHRAFVDRFRAQGVEFLAVEYCPHHPDGTVGKYRVSCGCRKPKTGMAEKVLAQFGDRGSYTIWVVGDKMTDILMGRNLGAKTILVATGYGESERAEGERLGLRPDWFVSGIKEAAERILSAGE